MFHSLEAMFFIEWDILFILRHSLDIQVVLIFFLDAFQQFPGNALPLIIGMHKNIVDLCSISLSSSARIRPTSLSPSQTVSTVEECIRAL